ncbi:MAG: Hsp20/alpha crystallin family protein [Rubrobacteridae bacterium]|nr:Hsp20/alpha crystallin family protein [Rubrobacteridae bacterium]
MAVQRWNPWRDLMRMQEDFNRTFESFVRPGVVSEFRWMPDVDVFEKEDKIMVRVDLPEIKAEDVDVSIIDNSLIIKGERKHTEEVKGEDYYMTERRFGAFERAIDLPAPVKPEEVHAMYRDGVLEVTLPKAEEKKSKEIKVKVA